MQINFIKTLTLSFIWVLLIASEHCQASVKQNIPPLNTTNLGTLVTTSKAKIENCTVAYRTFGTLNADKSNGVLWPTWFAGTSEHLFSSDIINKSIDTKGLYIIAVDALGNGVSSSPSNTANFPDISIRDMVNAQHRLLTEHLGINHLKAVIGISMGGMQAHEWSVAYPTFMDKVIAIVGTPQQSSFDTLVWQTQVDLIEHSGLNPNKQGFGLKKAYDIFTMNATTPAEFAGKVIPQDLPDYLNNSYRHLPHPQDYIAHAKAMINHDIYQSAKAPVKLIRFVIKADVMMIIAEQDQLVMPLSSIELSKNIKSELVILKGINGHGAPFVQTDEVYRATTRFMKQ